jgi:hypothetical protein
LVLDFGTQFGKFLFFILSLNAWKRGNKNPSIEGQITQWSKEKGLKENHNMEVIGLIK